MATLASAQAKMARKLKNVTQDDFCHGQIEMGVPADACARNFQNWQRKQQQIINNWAAGIQGQ